MIKEILAYSNSFYCRGKRVLRKNAGCLGDWVIFLCLRCDGKNLGQNFELGGVNIPKLNAFSRKVNNINLKNFSYIWWSIQVWEKIQQGFWREVKPKEFIDIWKNVSLRQILKDKGGSDLIPWELRYPWKRGGNRNQGRWNRRLSHLCTLALEFQKTFLQNLAFFNFFFGDKKRISSKSCSFIPRLLNSDLPSYGPNLRKWYTLSLLSICLEKMAVLEVILPGRGQMT